MADRLTTAYVGVGSNIEPEHHIRQALDLLRRQVDVTGSSTFYRTAPLAGRDEPSFLNGVWQIKTGLAARALKFDVLRSIEADLGRIRTTDKYAARSIDLDVLIYGELVINEPDLQIPDPDIRKRSFIAVPLLELAPELALPGTGELLASLVSAEEAARLEPARAFTRRLHRLLTNLEP